MEDHVPKPITTQRWMIAPPRRIPSRPWSRKARLLVRWVRFALSSARAGWWDFSFRAVRAITRLVGLAVTDLASADAVECNLCGWRGRRFYPNVGPGYDESATTCPGCLAQDRHRTLVAVLLTHTSALEAGARVVEVAPMRSMEELFLGEVAVQYTSFDLERHAMEHGDIMAMRFDDESVDYFICFHVLEHLLDEAAALSEIRRVLKPGGVAVIQVPIDTSLESTVEYGRPDPRDVGHVRRNGRDFASRVAASGFEVTGVSVQEQVPPRVVLRHGLNVEPIFLCEKTQSGLGRDEKEPAG